MKGRIIAAVNEKKASLAYEHFEEYLKCADSVNGDMFSLLFRSLSTVDDIPFFNKWMDYVTEHQIELGENSYTCAGHRRFSHIAIIQFFSGVGMEEEAMKYVNIVVEKGMKIKYSSSDPVHPRFRHYLPLLQGISDRGDIPAMRKVIAHMRENNIPFDENVYYYEMKTCGMLRMPFTVGLAGKDEELFVVCLKELMKAVDLVETEPMVDLLKAFVERQAFGIDVTRSYPSWVLKPCVILASGCCDVCGKQLRKEPLSLAAKHELASEVESLILSRASRSAASAIETRKTKEDRVENFLAFKAFLAKTGPYDIFLDGANIAHYKQNFDGGCFNYQQIQMVAEYLLRQKKRILIVLHEHHFNQAGTTLPEQWLERGLAYKVVKGNNDDLYWMYAALAADNDAMVRTGAGREA